MATLSIEILFPTLDLAIPEDRSEALKVAISRPPVSDRGPSPLWQEAMSALGGTLVHLCDPACGAEPQRWAYEIIEESNWRRFRFRPPVAAFVWQLLKMNSGQGTKSSIWFYSDAQWSNSARTFTRSYSLDAFRAYHDRCGIRMNTAFRIKI